MSNETNSIEGSRASDGSSEHSQSRAICCDEPDSLVETHYRSHATRNPARSAHSPIAQNLGLDHEQPNANAFQIPHSTVDKTDCCPQFPSRGRGDESVVVVEVCGTHAMQNIHRAQSAAILIGGLVSLAVLALEPSPPNPLTSAAIQKLLLLGLLLPLLVSTVLAAGWTILAVTLPSRPIRCKVRTYPAPTNVNDHGDREDG